MSCQKIQKQYDNIRDKHVKTIVEKWGKKQFHERVHKLHKLVETAQKSVLHELKPLPQGLFLVSDDCFQLFVMMTMRLVAIDSTFMDMYTMGRCLRTFEDGTDPENVVIYVGDFHAQAYRGLFKKKLHAKVVRELYGKNKCEKDSCINVSSILNKS